jgi:Flp pilus assembly protein TadG
MLVHRPQQVPRHATATVEFAVMMIFLVPLLLYGLWEVGRIVEVSQILSNAAREGARQAAIGEKTPTTIDIPFVQAVVIDYLKSEGLPTQNAVVTVTNLGYPGYGGMPPNPTPSDNQPYDATDLDHLQVVVTIPYQDVEWVNINLAASPTSLLAGQAVWSSCKDRAYPIPVPPVGSN